MIKKLLFAFLLVVGLAFAGVCWADDYSEELAKLEAKAATGDLEVISQLISIYQPGRGGVPKNPEKVLALMQQAADLGQIGYQKNLAMIYYTGKMPYNLDFVIEKDFAAARALYEKAALLGDSGAMYFLAEMYEKGEGGDKDLGKAKEWYQTSCDKGFTDSCNKVSALK